jgi:hypothetical protein
MITNLMSYFTTSNLLENIPTLRDRENHLIVHLIADLTVNVTLLVAPPLDTFPMSILQNKKIERNL